MKWRKLGPYSLICLKTLNYGRPSPLSVTKFSEGPRCLLLIVILGKDTVCNFIVELYNSNTVFVVRTVWCLIEAPGSRFRIVIEGGDLS